MRRPAPGDVIATKYRLEEVVGEGGLAVVFRATDTSVGRTVAVKVLKPGDDGYDLGLAARFTREARTLASLRDGNTLRMFDFGQDHGLLFMVFEYLEGEDLQSRIARQLLTAEEAIHVLRQVLSSLREAHAAGLLHRDIKPSNIFVFPYLDDPLRVKLIDFGIARHTDANAVSLTQTGAVLGTPRYMAPEQLYGEPEVASDIYSLGLVIAEAMTGDVRKARELFARGRRLDIDGVPSWFTNMVGKMCEGDPNHRFASADEVLETLDRGIQGETAGSGPRPVVLRAHPEPSSSGDHPQAYSGSQSDSGTISRSGSVRPPGRHRRTIGLALAGIFLFSVSVAVWFASRSPSQEPPPNRPSERPSHALLRDEVVEPADERPAEAVADLGSRSQDADRPTDASGACPTSVQHGDVPIRDAMLHVPADAKVGEALPLLIVFPADGSDVLGFLNKTRLRHFAEKHRFHVLGFEMPKIGAWRDGVDPEPFRRAVDDARLVACIDSRRIFALGHGSGGGAAESLSCEPWVRAIATTAFRKAQNRPSCRDAPPIPVLHIAPMKTQHMPVEGGSTCAGFSRVISLEEHEALWRIRNNCTNKRTPYLRDGKTVCYDWSRCDARFGSCHVDSGHGWPGEGKRLVDLLKCDGPKPTFDYLGTIWDFFEALDD